jgi:7-carboxy-7-deazaguanine synthase
MEKLLEAGYEVVLETSGAVDARSVDPRVTRILDLKAPGSGESARNHWATFDELRSTDEIKIVIADRADFEWARDAVLERRLSAKVACVLFSPVYGELDPARLAEWILDENLPVVLQMQEHKILWPGVERGI